jgi:murein DD-endopeptidase MepM/ murein hydrolase activator NlpD
VIKKENKKGKFRQKLIDKYRLVVLNEDTFEERFSLKLSRLNVFVLGGIFTVILVALTTVFIAFTPIREYIPGYSSTQLKKKAANLIFEADSLKTKLAILENYTNALKPILTGEIAPETVDSIRSESERFVIDESKLNASKKDSLFRESVESKDRFPLLENDNLAIKVVFFSPVSGGITQKFNTDNKHYAVDIVAKKGTPVKAVTDGTVILSEWTAETGYVITIQHAKGFISVYKHNGNLLKEQGDFVKSGEVIASVGSTGELTTGAHLHFELWSDGYPVNPLNFIDFK